MPHPDMGAHWEGGHPDEGLLHEWLDEQLSDEAASHIALHVAACAECAGVVAEARGLIAASRRILSALDEVPAGVLPAGVVAAKVFGASAGTPDASDSASLRIVAGNLGSRSSVASSTVAPQARRVAPTRWRRIGAIAAVLVVAVATPFMLRDRSITVPSQSISSAVSEVSQGGSAAAADAAVRVDGATPSERLAERVAERPAAAAMQAPVASGTVAKAAPGVNKNEPAIDEATAKAAAANLATADRVSTDRALSGRVTAKRAQAAVGAAAATVASADITNANVAPQLRADSVVTQRASVGVAGGAAIAVESRASARRSLAAAAPMAAPPPAASEKGMAFADASGVALFDSITVTRRVCDPSCTATTLHISVLGVVRYTISSGSNERVVRSQISAADRTRLGSLLMRQFSGVADRHGVIACALPTENGSALQIEIAFGATVAPETTLRCAATPLEVRALADSIDTIVNVSELRRGSA